MVFVLGLEILRYGVMTEALKAVLDFVLLKQAFKKSRHVSRSLDPVSECVMEGSRCLSRLLAMV